eukprot:CAMPEP_0119008386 /NCGR_PEP_ID=MMETSP1176-20130426/3653_1 /TAXON_ID=265551 /ORGANISM="Synedropsis recta cf, Strain CCMP1620" /LENGTH=603 /DNA_ID=CAMNT_0006960705 /DNA_START=115 /DNA_END=1926 /DNA_ORIENTATION=+
MIYFPIKREFVLLTCTLLSVLVCQSLAFSPSLHPAAAVVARVAPTTTTTSLYVNVATSILRESMESGGDKPSGDGNNNNKKLSRPERKALERETKERRLMSAKRRRKHDFSDRSEALQGKRAPGEGRYELHSNSVSQLSKESTADDVVKAIKRAQNLHDVHDIRAIERFLLEEAPSGFGYGYFGSLLSRLAVAALHMDEQQLALKALDERRLHHTTSIIPMESAAIIRGLLRVHNVTDAFQVLDEELALPPPEADLTTEENQELVKQRALSLGSIASRHFFEGEPKRAVQACQLLTEIGPVARNTGITADEMNMPWARILQGAAQCETKRRDGTVKACEDVEVELPCNLVYSALNAMTAFPSTNDDRTYEILSNSLVRRVVFITGAINMAGCPPADRGEAVFIGRSNVGKSSLVNMITNRKSLAYTSKTPGKTQQFNFFAVNDKPEKEREVRYGDDIKGEKDPDSFYMVDLPGFGFAKVPEQQRQEWARFMTEYIQTRKTLKVIFHLVDSRHGPTAEDARIMKQVGEVLPKRVTYVVVLTKADKNIKGVAKTNDGKVARNVMDSLRETMKQHRLGNAPVILSSAETKLGRDDLWRYLRGAAES